MDLSAIIFIALALAMDAFAVSITLGALNRQRHLQSALKFGFSFGFFQMFMPVAGWALGLTFYGSIQPIDHWISFILLSAIGLKMIREAKRLEKLDQEQRHDGVWLLLGLSVATSIDALVVGMTFAFLDISVILPAVIIGLVTFMLSFLGAMLGSKFGHLLEGKMEIIGGAILIAMGVKILFQHLFNF